MSISVRYFMPLFVITKSSVWLMPLAIVLTDP
jgi:hypothetical protein